MGQGGPGMPQPGMQMGQPGMGQPGMGMPPGQGQFYWSTEFTETNTNFQRQFLSS